MTATVTLLILLGFCLATADGTPCATQAEWRTLPSGVRMYLDRPPAVAERPARLVLYATPNGNTIEQTLGCAPNGLNFRFDIQHVAAQIGRLREIESDGVTALAVVEAPKLSWPAFRQDEKRSSEIIAQVVRDLIREVAPDRVVLAGHSGGGAFLLSFLASPGPLPESLERFVFLDANYSYSDEPGVDGQGHGDKLLAWLRDRADRRLVVVAYDDREIELNGKKVIGPTGGTYRATHRMLDRFRRDLTLTENTTPPFQHWQGLSGQIEIAIHPNPENRILHTALVGEMNGLLHGVTVGLPLATRWGTFGGPRAYEKWIAGQPISPNPRERARIAPDTPVASLDLPARPADADSAEAFLTKLRDLPRDARARAIVAEVQRGNVPAAFRRLVPITVHVCDAEGQLHDATYFVTGDYLSIGADGDFFRWPLDPAHALQIADGLHATLLTTKLSDQIWSAADVKLAPHPLTEARDQPTAFAQHNAVIQKQLENKTGRLVAGIKKDVVISNRLKETTHRVAIYGWHREDGRPIQPLYVGHVDWYVDYSHGIRLLSRRMIVDGQERDAVEILRDPRLHVLLSDEGPIDMGAVRRAAEWQVTR